MITKAPRHINKAVKIIGRPSRRKSNHRTYPTPHYRLLPLFEEGKEYSVMDLAILAGNQTPTIYRYTAMLHEEGRITYRNVNGKRYYSLV